jgi:hypothetical protein
VHRAFLLRGITTPSPLTARKLREALEGRFDTEHAPIVSQILAHIDFLDEAIDRLSDQIEERIAPFRPAA